MPNYYIKSQTIVPVDINNISLSRSVGAITPDIVTYNVGYVLYGLNIFNGLWYDVNSDVFKWLNRENIVVGGGDFIGGSQTSAYFAIKDRATPIPIQVGKSTITEIVSSIYGGVIPIVYGYAKINSDVIWAASIKEVLDNGTSIKDISSIGVDTYVGVYAIYSGSSYAGTLATKTFNDLGKTKQQIDDWYTNTIGAKIGYKYFATFASAICEGEIKSVISILANGKEIWKLGQDLPTYIKIYTGTETQLPDPTIESYEGVGNYTAHRGLSYIVFTDMPLTDYNNQAPTITVEVEGALTNGSLLNKGYKVDSVNDMELNLTSSNYGLHPLLFLDKEGIIAKIENEMWFTKDLGITQSQVFNGYSNINGEAIVYKFKSYSYNQGKIIIAFECQGKSTHNANTRVFPGMVVYDVNTGSFDFTEMLINASIHKIDYDEINELYVAIDSSVGKIYTSANKSNWVLVGDYSSYGSALGGAGTTYNNVEVVSGGKITVGHNRVYQNGVSVFKDWYIYDYMNAIKSGNYIYLKKIDSDLFSFVNLSTGTNYNIGITSDFININSVGFNAGYSLVNREIEFNGTNGGNLVFTWWIGVAPGWKDYYNGITINPNTISIISAPGPLFTGKWISSKWNYLKVWNYKGVDYINEGSKILLDTIDNSGVEIFKGGKSLSNTNINLDKISVNYTRLSNFWVKSSYIDSTTIPFYINTGNGWGAFKVFDINLINIASISHTPTIPGGTNIDADLFRFGDTVYHVYRDSVAKSVDPSIWNNVSLPIGSLPRSIINRANGIVKNVNTNLSTLTSTLISMGGKQVYSFDANGISIAYTAPASNNFISDVAVYGSRLYVLLDDRWIYRIDDIYGAKTLIRDLSTDSILAYTFKFQGSRCYFVTDEGAVSNNIYDNFLMFSFDIGDGVLRTEGFVHSTTSALENMLYNVNNKVAYKYDYVANGNNVSDGVVAVADIIVDISKRCNIPSNDYSVNVASALYGYTIDRESTGRSAINPLLEGYFIEAYDSNGMKFIDKSNSNNYELILEGDIVPYSNGDLVKTERIQVLELPKRVNVDFIDYNDNLSKGTVYSEKIISNSNRIITMGLPIAMSKTEAKRISEKKLYTDIIERNFHHLKLSNKYSYLDASDKLEIRINGETYFVRIDQIYNNMDMTLTLRCLNDDISAFKSKANVVDAVAISPVNQNTVMNFIDTVSLSDIRPNDLFFSSTISGLDSNWVGGTKQEQLPNGSWNTIVDVPSEPEVGITKSIINVSSGNTFDNVNKLLVKGFFNLSSLTDIDILNGSNKILIGDELIQYVNAVLIRTDPINGSKTYEISRLLRGRRGSVIQQWPLSTRVIVINNSLTKVSAVVQDIGVVKTYRGFTHTFSPNTNYNTYSYTGANLQPLSVVHLKSNTGADINLSWIRRTRYNQEWLDLFDVGVGEVTEEYDIIITDSTIIASGPGLVFIPAVSRKKAYTNNFIYSVADQIIDFGYILPSGSTIDIYQISSIVGRGKKATYTI